MSQFADELEMFGHDAEIAKIQVSSVVPNATLVMLEDGTTVEMTAMPTEVSRIEKRWLPSGEPVYWVNYQVLVQVASFEEELGKPST